MQYGKCLIVLSQVRTENNMILSIMIAMMAKG